MTTELQWRTVVLDSAKLDPLLREADTNRNGWLLDPEDRLPKFQYGSKSGLVMVTPNLQALYRPTTLPGVRESITVLLEDSAKKIITSQEIVAMMQQNGGHLVRLGDLARLFPQARLRGEGQPLAALEKARIQTIKYPEGKPLADALIDPGGELIVSHFFEKELKQAAPSFTQFMTNERGKHSDPKCHNSETAFTRQSCNPDSWPVDIDTLLQQAHLELASPSKNSSKNYREIFQWLRNQQPIGIIKTKTGLKIDLKDPQLLKSFLGELNKNFPSLHADPRSLTDIDYHLGGATILKGSPNAKHWRRMLLAILNEPDVAVAYGSEDANNPALFNKAAIRPTLHFAARLSPKNLDRVIFAILHIDAQSYKPRGSRDHKTIHGPDEVRPHSPPQHQGEVEPLYLTYRKSTKKGFWTLEEAYLGDHLVAEPVKAKHYRGNLAIAYGSGGKIQLRQETAWLPGMMLRAGMQSAAMAYALNWGSSFDWLGEFAAMRKVLFPFIEVYPGLSDTTGPHPRAKRFTPKDYNLSIEGTQGDFLTTGRLLVRNGGGGDEAFNQSGIPFLRGTRKPDAKSERNRQEVGLHDYLEAQKKYHDNYLMGGISTIAAQASLFPKMSFRKLPSFLPGEMRLSLRHDVLGTAWFRPGMLDLYLYNPFSRTIREIPQMALHIHRTTVGETSLDFNVDFAGLRGGALWDWGGVVGEIYTGLHLYSQFSQANPFGGGIHLNLGVYLLLQRGYGEIRIGIEARGELDAARQEGRAEFPNGWVFYPLSIRIGRRFRRQY